MIQENPEISWSLSRYLMFKRCPLEYYYHYYASWGGWESGADERTSRFYHLKNLKTVRAFCEWVIKKSIDDFISGQKSDKDDFRRMLFQNSNQYLCEFRTQAWLEDPKKLNLVEFYYGQLTVDAAVKMVYEALEILFVNFAENALSLFAQIPFNAVKSIRNPACCYVGGVKVWSNPGIVYDYGGRVRITNIFFDDPRTSQEWAMKSAVDAIFAESEFYGRDAETISLFLHEKNFPAVYAHRNLKEMRFIISASVSEMKAALNFGADGLEDFFASFADCSNCSSCRFKELCVRSS